MRNRWSVVNAEFAKHIVTHRVIVGAEPNYMTYQQSKMATQNHAVAQNLTILSLWKT